VWKIDTGKLDGEKKRGGVSAAHPIREEEGKTAATFLSGTP